MRKTTLFVTLLRNSDEITVCDDGTSFVLSGSYCNEEEFEYKYFLSVKTLRTVRGVKLSFVDHVTAL